MLQMSVLKMKRTIKMFSRTHVWPWLGLGLGLGFGLGLQVAWLKHT